MILNQQELEDAKAQLEYAKAQLNEYEAQLKTEDASNLEIEHLLTPLMTFYARYEAEILAYEHLVESGPSGVAPLERLIEVGRYLVELRIAQKLTQEDLAQRLETSLEQVITNERTEYCMVSSAAVRRALREITGSPNVQRALPCSYLQEQRVRLNNEPARAQGGR